MPIPCRATPAAGHLHGDLPDRPGPSVPPQHGESAIAFGDVTSARTSVFNGQAARLHSATVTQGCSTTRPGPPEIRHQQRPGILGQARRRAS